MEVIIVTVAYLAMVGAGLALAKVTNPLFIRTLARFSKDPCSLNEVPKERALAAANHRAMMRRVEARQAYWEQEKQFEARRRQERADVFFNKKEVPFSYGGGKVFVGGPDPSRPNDLCRRDNGAAVRFGPKP